MCGLLCWSEKMAERETDAAGDASLDQALGYLNFSSGTSDPLFLARINALFGRVAKEQPQSPAWQGVGKLLKERLEVLSQIRGRFQGRRAGPRVSSRWSLMRLCGPIASITGTCCSIIRTRRSSAPFLSAASAKQCCGRGPPGARATASCRGRSPQLNDFHRPPPGGRRWKRRKLSLTGTSTCAPFRSSSAGPA